MSENGKTKRISEDLHEKIVALQQSFEKKEGIEISYIKATKVLAKRIDNAGGLRV